MSSNHHDVVIEAEPVETKSEVSAELDMASAANAPAPSDEMATTMVNDNPTTPDLAAVSLKVPNVTDDASSPMPMTATMSPRVAIKMELYAVMNAAPLHDVAMQSTIVDVATNDESSGMVEEASPGPKLAFLAIEDATLIGLLNREIPYKLDYINSFVYWPKMTSSPPFVVISRFVHHLYTNTELPPGGDQAVHDILKSLYKVEELTLAQDKVYNISWLVKSIMGESPKATKPFAFPGILADQAAIVLARLQDDFNVGLPVEATAVTTPPSNSVPPTRAQKKGTSKKREAKQMSTDNPTQSKRLDMSNPTIDQLMHNVSRDKNGKAYKIVDHSLKIDYNKWGDNGLNVGDWWPFQVCTLRDGAHGSAQGGIAGGSMDGAKSIVVGGKSSAILLSIFKANHTVGGYEGMDIDEGDTIYFSGSNSHENEDPTVPFISNNTKALQRSHQDKRAIRVLRSQKNKSSYAPSAGFRYDGLYKIVEEQKKGNLKGGAYLRFKLVRLGGQDPIDHSRPNSKEKAAFKVIKESVLPVV